MSRFIGQVAIVAGGARGIGEGIVKRLASEGAKLMIFDLMESELRRTLAECKAKGMQVEGELLDISDEDQVRSGMERVKDKYGRIDILVNCAGIVGPTSIKITDYDTKAFDQVVKVNLKGPFLLTKHVIPKMLEHNYGRILHITSIGGKEGNPGMIGYAASKSGLMGLVKGAGKEYAETGITINGLAPAVIATKMNEDTHPDIMKYMLSKIPMKRLGTIEEVTSLSCWIVSKEASFNTGFIFDISGGRATY